MTRTWATSSSPPVDLQLHRLDHRVLDPEHPPPYPRRAHAVPVFVSVAERPRAEDRAACALHSTIFTGSHPSNQGSGSLRAQPGRPPACPQAPARGAAEVSGVRKRGPQGPLAQPIASATLEAGGAAAASYAAPRTDPQKQQKCPLRSPAYAKDHEKTLPYPVPGGQRSPRGGVSFCSCSQHHCPRNVSFCGPRPCSKRLRWPPTI